MEREKVGPAFRAVWRRTLGVEVILPPGREGYGPDDDGTGVEGEMVQVFLRVQPVFWKYLLPRLCRMMRLPWTPDQTCIYICQRFYEDERGELCFCWWLRCSFAEGAEEQALAVLTHAIQDASEEAAAEPPPPPPTPIMAPVPAAAPASAATRTGGELDTLIAATPAIPLDPRNLAVRTRPTAVIPRPGTKGQRKPLGIVLGARMSFPISGGGARYPAWQVAPCQGKQPNPPEYQITLQDPGASA
jgi:hypothetical protein